MRISNPEKELNDLAYVWVGKVNQTLALSQKRTIYNVKQPDALRLLSLRTWTLKYNLPLEDILQLLVGYWTKRFERKFKKQQKGRLKPLGVRIGTLCGDVSEEILKTHIDRTYPGNEHIKSWKATQQEKYLKIQEIGTTYRTIEAFMKRYRATTVKARTKNQKVLDKGELTKRRYPGNPWI